MPVLRVLHHPQRERMNLLLRIASYCLLSLVRLRDKLIDRYVLPRYRFQLAKLEAAGFIIAAPPSEDMIRLALAAKVSEAFSRVLWSARDFDEEEGYPFDDFFVVGIVYPIVAEDGTWTLMVEVSSKATGAEVGALPLSMFLTGFVPQEEIELTQYNS
jgi:hypothetical protein